MTTIELYLELEKLITKEGNMPILVQDSEGNASEVQDISILSETHKLHGVPKVAIINIP